MAGRLILILGDQLSMGLSSLRAANRACDTILMAEVWDEATYVPHHPKKIALVLSAMRHFAARLRAEGWRVDYVALEDAGNTGSLADEVARAMGRHGTDHLIATEPGEWRLMRQMRGWPATTLLPDDRFLADRHGFAQWADGRKGLRMEHFYRLMRRKTGLLMDGDQPAGGQWNYDHDNRAPPPGALGLPEPMAFAPDAITAQVLDMVERRFGHHFGDLRPFWFAVTQADAQAAFAHFIAHALPGFGRYQDAMLIGHAFLHHAVVSPYLNLGLLDPLDMCRAVEAEWRAGRVPLNSAEGFIRQIIGWREFVRGIYWWQGPDYARGNVLEAHRPLPAAYWGAPTSMACLSACVAQTRHHAYAHHIQRLMVTGNFALLAGIDPHALHEWYLAVYADAFEWVELPNTIGMSQFADGGLLASKPYAASGAYIARMSDYCAGCAHSPKVQSGPRACPFTLLYWHFIARHADRLRRNPRMAAMVRNWERFSPERQAQLQTDAQAFLAALA
ncbi:cryptochrome/photolyase family protein [Novosphingobium sp. FSY-8]|uniref:Cryptochrome/photolyase family protein n=1 Tax=Novosphingobium ovatum TaxID=1908523 RepID=A0ABW9XGZ5_9SPHN|nr:cryptochrome/photolyase family protein [Novosphingobium ovatum]NBC37771.1 cryptochrome/photolyase family protein [Novosphingobium ovatum]